MKGIIMIGQFPGQLNGLTIANQTLEKGLKKSYQIEKIDLSLKLEFENKEEQGKFKFKKFCLIICKMLRDIKKMLKSNGKVVYMTPGQSFLGFMRLSPYMLICIIKNAPYYNHIHGGYFRKMYNSQSKFKKILLDFFLKNSTGVIVLGNSLKNMFDEILPEDKIFVCENGVQDNVIATEQEITKKVEEYKKDTKKRILYLSNLMIEKGVLDLLEASEKFTDDEIELNLAGAIEPNVKNKVEEYLKKYPNKIKYHGIVKGKYKKKLLQENYIFILPTYYSNEGQPISILEAYAAGCAVITDESTGGIKDIFSNGINGISIKSKDVDSIYSGIKFIDESKYFEKNHKILKENYTSILFIERIKKIICQKSMI
ncbi:glycosyltransferase family 4 protein [Cetobacterium somerae]